MAIVAQKLADEILLGFLFNLLLIILMYVPCIFIIL